MSLTHPSIHPAFSSPSPNTTLTSQPSILHPSLSSFKTTLENQHHPIHPPSTQTIKEYTLIIPLLLTTNRILLGLKHRGFGLHKYNGFGGKFETHTFSGSRESACECAVRELKEECNITCSESVMEEAYVGVLRFSFQDGSGVMKVYLFCVDIDVHVDDDDIDASDVKGCDEITPEWFNIDDIPYSNMFADDSTWLPLLIAAKRDSERGARFRMDGYYHFKPGGDEVNEIDFYYIDLKSDDQNDDNEDRSNDDDNANDNTNSIKLCQDITPKDPSPPTPPSKKYTLEQTLFHRIHNYSLPGSLKYKEFQESYSFATSCISHYKTKTKTKTKSNASSTSNSTTNSTANSIFDYDYIIDVAGGHGALCALFLILCPNLKAGVVIDPAPCKSGIAGVQSAWGYLHEGRIVRYRHDTLQVALSGEIEFYQRLNANGNNSNNKVLVVACHACQFLTDLTLAISQKHNLNVSVMPCCQKSTPSLKTFAKAANISVGLMSDIMTAGRMEASYNVKIKLLANAKTPQNRLIMCSVKSAEDVGREEEGLLVRVGKLEVAYGAAHRVAYKDYGSGSSSGKSEV